MLFTKGGFLLSASVPSPASTRADWMLFDRGTQVVVNLVVAVVHVVVVVAVIDGITKRKTIFSLSEIHIINSSKSVSYTSTRSNLDPGMAGQSLLHLSCNSVIFGFPIFSGL